MKEKTTGKRMSTRRTTTFDTTEELADYFKAEGRPNGEGRLTLCRSFDDEVKAYSEAARAFLKEQGLPSSLKVFKTASQPKRYVETDEPEAVDFAQWCHTTQGCEGPLPTVGKCLDPAITVTWEEEKPEDERLIGSSLLTSYLMNERGFAHDALETLAAEIIECGERIQKLEGEYALSAAMKLGETVTLFRHYYRSGKSQKSNATKPRSDVTPLIKQLARQERAAKELWPHLFALMEKNGMSPEECSLTGDYRYLSEKDENRRLTLKTFQNRLSIERKKTQ